MALPLLTLLLLAVPVETATSAQDARPAGDASKAAFEVASVRTSSSGLVEISPYGSNHFFVRGASLALLISMAYGVSDAYILEGPTWQESEYYDIAVKAEDGVALTYDALAPRLRNLLETRFNLMTHRVVREVQGYALVVVPGGPRLTASDTAAARAAILQGGVRAAGISMDSLASVLARPLGQPVVNETHLSGHYDVSLDYAPPNAPDALLPSIFTTVEEELGLKLVSRTVPVDMLVIDHVERPTAD